MESSDAAWAAGLFEGEGSVISHKSSYARADGSRLRIPRITVLMTTEEPVRRIADLFGVGTIKERQPRKLGHRTAWDWYVESWDDVLAIFLTIRPWLSERRLEQFARVFDECNASVQQKRPWHPRAAIG